MKLKRMLSMILTLVLLLIPTQVFAAEESVPSNLVLYGSVGSPAQTKQSDVPIRTTRGSLGELYMAGTIAYPGYIYNGQIYYDPYTSIGDCRPSFWENYTEVTDPTVDLWVIEIRYYKIKADGSFTNSFGEVTNMKYYAGSYSYWDYCQLLPYDCFTIWGNLPNYSSLIRSDIVYSPR